MLLNPTRFLLTLILAVSAASARAQNALEKLSPGARAEIERLSPTERDELAGVAQTPSANSDGNDFLCSRWGCIGGALRLGFDDWKSVPEGDYPSKYGSSIGFESASPIPGLQSYGLGAQLAMSYGLYSLNGRDFSQPKDSYTQQQFYSVGLFRRPDPFGGSWTKRWGAGVAYDAQGNRSAGSRADTFTLQQIRAKASFYLSASHEVGIWTAWRLNSVNVFNEQAIGVASLENDTYASVDQLNFFYKYAFANGGSVSAYIGPGVGGSITQPSQVDTFVGAPNIPGAGPHVFRMTTGAQAVAPFNDRFALYGGGSYGMPDISPMRSPQASVLNAWTVSTGIRFYWGANARVHDDSGRHWMPYLPAPDNGNFIQQSNYVE